MTEEFKHPADAPEQEITSEAAELLGQGAMRADATEPTPPEEDEPFLVGGPPPSAMRSDNPPSEQPTVLPPKLERLQKILAQAGIASRRHAEELITQGRVQVNGQTVIALGSKADPGRDHIRVDGKLLEGAERLRYFMLNKPKGYVTSVTDPLGRPTVMEFFAKQSERLYPVGRLDYQSEGLLLVTNDGDLAHRLTRAASGVEKTYLVKVAGQPSEAALDRLRGGVTIEKGKPAEGKVRTAAARIEQVRAGDNPWYEVVLIEGRNRELRKMFEEIGHHVEKIRRVGYGPLVLDVEPGKVRTLDLEEVRALRLTAEGKLKPRRPKVKPIVAKDAGVSSSRPRDPGSSRRAPEQPRFRRSDESGEKGARSFPSRRRDKAFGEGAPGGPRGRFPERNLRPSGSFEQGKSRAGNFRPGSGPRREDARAMPGRNRGQRLSGGEGRERGNRPSPGFGTRRGPASGPPRKDSPPRFKDARPAEGFDRSKPRVGSFRPGSGPRREDRSAAPGQSRSQRPPAGKSGERGTRPASGFGPRRGQASGPPRKDSSPRFNNPRPAVGFEGGKVRAGSFRPDAGPRREDRRTTPGQSRNQRPPAGKSGERGARPGPGFVSRRDPASGPPKKGAPGGFKGSRKPPFASGERGRRGPSAGPRRGSRPPTSGGKRPPSRG